MPITLKQIRVAEPCHVDWEKMTGDARSRFCAHCQRHVHDVSGMTDAALNDLVCKNAGRLCVRYAADATGMPLALNYAGGEAVARRNWRRFIPVAVFSILAAGCASFSVARKPQPPMMVMGLMVVSPQLPQAGGCEAEAPSERE